MYLTLVDRRRIWINPMFVKTIFANGDATSVDLGAEDIYMVMEAMDTVATMVTRFFLKESPDGK